MKQSSTQGIIPGGVRFLGGLVKAALIAGSLALTHAAGAATFPSGPIKLIVPFPPGGAVDTIGRQLAVELSKQLGQPVVIENRAGAAGAIGVAATVNAAPDGYTLVVGASSNVAVDPAQEKLPYNPRDLAPVAPVVAIPYVIVANPGFAPNNIRELIAAAKREPGKINFASSGTGAPPHLASELLLAQAGVDIKHIPYKGAVPAFTDVVGGQVQFITGDINTAMPFLQAGKLKAIATTGRQRLELLPNVPTVAESGLPNYEAEGWFGLFAPARTPPDVLAQLTKATEAAVQTPDFKKRMAALGGRIMTMPRAEFERYIASETIKRSDLIKSNKIELGN
jgi:tripartite-type tricarboxylate transporter receptor subunit TctC